MQLCAQKISPGDVSQKICRVQIFPVSWLRQAFALHPGGRMDFFASLLNMSSDSGAASQEGNDRKRSRGEQKPHDSLFESDMRFLADRPCTRAIKRADKNALAAKREAFIRFCEREHDFLRKIDASCCLLVICWIYTRRTRSTAPRPVAHRRVILRTSVRVA